MEEVCWSIHYSNLSGYYWTPSKGWPLMAGPKSPRVLKLAHKEYPLSVLLVHHDVYTLQNYTWSQISWFPIWEFSLSKRYFASSILNFRSVTMCSLRVNVKFEQTSLISSYELFSMCTSSWNSKKTICRPRCRDMKQKAAAAGGLSKGKSPLQLRALYVEVLSCQLD